MAPQADNKIGSDSLLNDEDAQRALAKLNRRLLLILFLPLVLLVLLGLYTARLTNRVKEVEAITYRLQGVTLFLDQQKLLEEDARLNRILAEREFTADEKAQFVRVGEGLNRIGKELMQHVPDK